MRLKKIIDWCLDGVPTKLYTEDQNKWEINGGWLDNRPSNSYILRLDSVSINPSGRYVLGFYLDSSAGGECKYVHQWGSGTFAYTNVSQNEGRFEYEFSADGNSRTIVHISFSGRARIGGLYLYEIA